MAWFDPRAFGRAARSHARTPLVLGTSIATVVGLSALVTGGFAQSPDESPGAVAQAKNRNFAPVCVQRHGGNASKGDLNIRLRSQCAKGQDPLKLALWPVKRRRGAAGPQGAQGPQGPQGARGPAGSQGPKGNTGPPVTAEVGFASVFVDRGDPLDPSRWATYSVPLLAPGSTTGGQFRFSCSATQAPCEVSLGAAVISSETGTTGFYPRLLIHGHDGPGPMNFCEYADGANNNLGVAQVQRVPTLADALTATTPPGGAIPMGIGGSLDCGDTGQTEPDDGVVTEIWVPAGFYDVWATLAFGNVPAPEDNG